MAQEARPLSATIDARTGVYQDSDHTTISTTAVAARALIKERVRVEARYLVDVVSSASIDVVTAATGAFRDTRHEVTAGVGYRDGTSTADVGYIYSRENDWESHTVSLGGSRDVLSHNLTLGLGGSYVWNDVGRSGDMNYHKRLHEVGIGASATYTASPRDLISLSYSLAYLSGYQGSPYRFVIFTDEGGLRASQPEDPPETRQRHAVAVRWLRHVGSNSAVHSHLRGYVDDWQVVSLTGGTEVQFGLGPFVLAPHVRGYVQRHAGFYQPTYTQRVNFMTFDRELSTFFDVFYGLKLRFARRHLGPLEELRAEAKIDGFGFYFFDFPRLQSRYGLIAELAVGVSL